VPQLAGRRILGEAPVAADGSFKVEVPANTPIQLQLLDERGLALRSCGWIWTRNHEPQGCIGCHEDLELTPTNLLVNALTVETVSVAASPEKRQAVDFRRHVMPILEKKCVPCHAPVGNALSGVPEPAMDVGPAAPGTPRRAFPTGTTQRDLDADTKAKTAYETLLAREPASDDRSLNWKYVDPGKARASPLFWHVCGVNTSRPWDGPAAGRPAKPIPPGKSEPLSPEETPILIRWIDLGAAWEIDAAGDGPFAVPPSGGNFRKSPAEAGTTNSKLPAEAGTTNSASSGGSLK
jgi:hypothetical protein